jgi:integrase
MRRMSASHSSKERPPVTDPPPGHKPARLNPAKPCPEYPLYAHAVGQWAKIIRGAVHYFGPWADSDAALTRYLEQRDDLHAGRRPRAKADAANVKALANAFLAAKQERVDSGERSPRTWRAYKDVCDAVVSAFGKRTLLADLRPDDFAALRARLARRYGPHRLANTVQYVRRLFKFAYETELIDGPQRFGAGFVRPTKKTVRLHKAAQGPRALTADEARALLSAAGTPLKAMVLLGLNAGLGNADCGRLPLAALDLDAGFLDYPRPKTGVARRAALWPETVAALRESLAKRPGPKDEADSGLVFITKYGTAWAKGNLANPISAEFRKLSRKLGVNGGRCFYTLRHTYRTVADGAKDQPAADFTMGREVAHMSSNYREGIDDARLRAVADHARAWLFGKPAAGTGLESAPAASE